MSSGGNRGQKNRASASLNSQKTKPAGVACKQRKLCITTKTKTKMEKNPKYCSSCKHSKYVKYTGCATALKCYLDEALGIHGTLPTDYRRAEDCLEFDPERAENALR